MLIRDNRRGWGGRGRCGPFRARTLRVGDVFLKIDSDETLADVEVAAMAWRRCRLRRSVAEPPCSALAALPGAALGRLGEQ